jgi:hypothetical protein
MQPWIQAWKANARVMPRSSRRETLTESFLPPRLVPNAHLANLLDLSGNANSALTTTKSTPTSEEIGNASARTALKKQETMDV